MLWDNDVRKSVAWRHPKGATTKCCGLFRPSASRTIRSTTFRSDSSLTIIRELPRFVLSEGESPYETKLSPTYSHDRQPLRCLDTAKAKRLLDETASRWLADRAQRMGTPLSKMAPAPARSSPNAFNRARQKRMAAGMSLRSCSTQKRRSPQASAGVYNRYQYFEERPRCGHRFGPDHVLR